MYRNTRNKYNPPVYSRTYFVACTVGNNFLVAATKHGITYIDIVTIHCVTADVGNIVTYRLLCEVFVCTCLEVATWNTRSYICLLINTYLVDLQVHAYYKVLLYLYLQIIEYEIKSNMRLWKQKRCNFFCDNEIKNI